MHKIESGDYMELSVFMDETSRTGQQRYNNKKWNFKEQPYFGLGALYIPSIKSEILYEELESVIEKEHIQGEFKWENKAARKRVSKLYPVIMDSISRNGAKIHFEIEDKRFTIAKIITEYCVLPYYDMTSDMLCEDKTKYVKRAFASYIADNLSDGLLWQVCTFFDSSEQNTTEFKKLIYKIITELDTKAIKDYCLETIDSIEMFEKGKSPLKINNLFPVKDTIMHNGSKTTLTIDPHTDCFGDLLGNAIKYFPECQKIKCVHDVQDQWKPALEETIERMRISHQQYSIELLTKTGYHTLVNIVDYISGYLNYSLRQLFEKNQIVPDDLRKLCDLNLTLVASVRIQEKLWDNNPDVIIVKELYEAIKKK